VSEPEADRADENAGRLVLEEYGLVMVDGELGETAGETEVVAVAKLAVPDLAESFGAGAGLMEGAEATVAAVDLSCLFAPKAMVVVELVLVSRLLLLHHYCLFLGRRRLLDLGVCAIALHYHILLYHPPPALEPQPLQCIQTEFKETCLMEGGKR
jgi:hypothetical protein